MNINSAPTNILVCVKDSLIKTNIHIISQKLKWVYKMVYLLGRKITSSGKNIEGINYSIGKTAFNKKH